MQGFQSQNSRTLVVTLGDRETGEVEIMWPSGTRQTITLGRGERLSVVEPE